MENPNIKNTLHMTSLLFGMMLLFCYIAWHLGYEGFIILGDVEFPPILAYLICSISLLINLSLQIGFVLNIYQWKVLRYSIPLALGSLVWSIWLPGVIFTGPVVMLCIFGIAIFQRKVKRAWWTLLLLNSVVIFHQIIVSQITATSLTYDVSMYSVVRLSIDSVLLMLLFYSIGGEKYYATRHSQSECPNPLESMVFPQRGRTQSDRNDGCQNSPQGAESVPLDKFDRWVMRSVIGVVQIIQWMLILWVCSLDNLFLDALVMTTSFICHGMIISWRKHLKPIILCTFAATAMFYIAARFTISFQYSQFFPIIIGLFLVYTIYRISYQFEKAVKERIKQDLARIEVLEQKVEEAWQYMDDLLDTE
jgi:hypothetical protein